MGVDRIYEPGRKLRASAQERVRGDAGLPKAIAILSGAAAITLLVTAAYQTSILVLVLAAVGSASGALSVWITGRLLNHMLDDHADRRRWLGPLVIGVGLAVTLLAATTAARISSQRAVFALTAVAALGLLTLMIGILVANQRIADASVREPALWLVASVALFFTALLSIGTGTPLLLTTIALLIWVISLTTLKISLTPLIRRGDASKVHRRATFVVIASLALTVLGVVLLVWNPLHRRLGPEPFATSFSISLVLLALSTAAIGAVNIDVSRVRWVRWTALAVGALATILGIFFTSRHLPEWPLALVFVCLVLFLVGAFFVLKGEGLIFLIVFGFLLALVLAPRTGTDATAENTGTKTLMILGDSFTSGEGASKFLPHTNTQDPTGNWCRRSPVSYGQLIGEQYDLRVFNYSCSGATTADILTQGQHRPDNELKQVVAGQYAQLDPKSPFWPERPDDVDLVLLGIGGNDAGFATVVKACLLPADCDDRAAEWLTLAEDIGGAVKTTYMQIMASLPNAEIVVIPYPSYVGFTSCNLALTDNEIGFVRDLIDAINAQAETQAALFAQVHYFDEIDRAYLNHSLCSSRPGANFLNLLPRSGNLLDRFAPDSWHNGTAHPNDRGHRCTAAVLGPWLEELLAWLPDPVGPFDAGDCRLASLEKVNEEEAKADRGGIRDFPQRSTKIPDPADSTKRCVQDLDEDRPACFDGDEWVGAQLDTTINKLAVPVGLLVLGGTLLALAAVWRLRDQQAERRLDDPEAETRALDVFVPEAPAGYGVGTGSPEPAGGRDAE